MEVLVLEDYQAQREDELTLTAGDVLRDVRQGSADSWLLGELAGRRGLFPKLIVLEIPESLRDDGGPRKPHTKRRGQPGGPPTTQRWCKVNFSYSPEQPDELKLQAGEVVQVLREIEDGWWLGKKNGQLGAFPSNFVQELDYRPCGAVIPDVIPKATGVAQSCPKLTRTQEETPVYPLTAPESCRVLFDYEPEAPDELALQRGTVVKVLRKTTEDPGWWEGEFEGKRGVFPDNFVLLLPPIKKLPVRRLSPQESVFGRENHVSSGRRRVSKETRAAKESKKMESKITLPPIKKLSSTSNRTSKPRPPTPRPLASGSAGDKLKNSREPGGRSSAGGKGGSNGGGGGGPGGVPGKSNDRSNDGVNDSKTVHSTHMRSKPQGRCPPSLDQTPTPGQEEEKPGLTKSQPPRTKHHSSDKAASRDKSSHDKAPSREKKHFDKPANRDKPPSAEKPLPPDKSTGRTLSNDKDKDEDKTASSRHPSTDKDNKPPPSGKLSSDKPPPDKPPSAEQALSDPQGAQGAANSEKRASVAEEKMSGISLNSLTERVQQVEAEVASLKGMLVRLVSQQEKDLSEIQEELKTEREMRLELQVRGAKGVPEWGRVPERGHRPPPPRAALLILVGSLDS
ncbi:SH3 domain-containing protein 21 isoform X2 [Dromiciops gliroides]|uniref:SH3 domain-containing protein 21 isoform X2 n=1 Tax=Dromiciops gliroides TaxID=33562 RepID=UPI001CC4C49C|nr:SH3 domain-containing protein 21 isoform X2 [Dromiciops gliroides]